MKRCILTIGFLFSWLLVCCQQKGYDVTSCGFEELTRSIFDSNDALIEGRERLEANYRESIKASARNKQNGIITLPVVVHIVHNNGIENIPDHQVLEGMALLNNAFRNQPPYYSGHSTDTELEFCLAQRDPIGNPTNGIVRYESPLTDMAQYPSIFNLFDSFGWDTEQYINIILVRDACLNGNCELGGFAVLPLGHGRVIDGIVIQAEYFGDGSSTSTIAVHEMGHYLGLEHTFKGGCTNFNCLLDGDKVCDTPPDNMTGNYPCRDDYNSCQSDTVDASPNNPFRSMAMDGLGDQFDLYRNYMDYSYKVCRDMFTQGQKERMHFFLNNARFSLLSSRACLPACASPAMSFFSGIPDSVEIGSSIVVSNLSSNSTHFAWQVDGLAASAEFEPTFLLNQVGEHSITLLAFNDSPLCDTSYFEEKVMVYCPVKAGFNQSVTNDWLYFHESTEVTAQFAWIIKEPNGSILYSSASPTDSFQINGNLYLQLCLTASNAFCQDHYCQYINLAGSGIEICDNYIDDDSDGYMDLFDQDCSCSAASYHAQCSIECEHLPEIAPTLAMKIKWVSELVGDYQSLGSNLRTGDVNGDGAVEVIGVPEFRYGNPQIANQSIAIFDGRTGISSMPWIDLPTWGYARDVSTADLDMDGMAELLVVVWDTIYCYSTDGMIIWKSDKLNDPSTLAPNIADFNGDGKPEVYLGNEIFNGLTGKRLVAGNKGAGCIFGAPFPSPCQNKHSIAADVLPSPGLELVAGNTVYQITLNNTNSPVGNAAIPTMAPSPVVDGFTSVADVDGDGLLDVVVVKSSLLLGAGAVYVWNPRTNSLIASANQGMVGGIAFVGNVIGDCRPEIGLALEYELRVYQYNGTQQLQLLFAIPTSDQSGYTGLTLFDFNQDGKQELVYRDESLLRILEGSTGAILAYFPIYSATGDEYPIVADIDNDGQAEILIDGSESANSDEVRIYCFESAGAPWAPARSVWNQYGYHVTNVNDDLTIPRQQQNQAQPLVGHENCLQPTCPAPYNAFLAQATHRTQQGCVQFPAVDLSAQALGYACSPDSQFVDLVIGNLSDSGMDSGCVRVSYYLTNPGIGGTSPLATFCVPFEGASMGEDTVRIGLALPQGTSEVFFVVNDPGTGANAANHATTGIIECDYANNIATVAMQLAPLSLDLGPDILKCESEVVTLDAGPGFATYAWNDATVEQNFSTSFEGAHFVEATDQCHRVYRDTVLVLFDHSLDVDLGPDLVVCPSDTLLFEVGSGYDMVQWLSTEALPCTNCTGFQLAADTSFTMTVVVGKASCYSVDTVQVSLRPRVEVQVSQAVCEGEPYSFMGETYSVAGQYAIPLNHCDSTLLLNLTVNPTGFTSLQSSICIGDSLLFHGSYLKTSGTYYHTTTNQYNCDSLVQLDLLVLQSIAFQSAVNVCPGDSVFVLGQWLEAGQSATATFNSASGCDSLVTMVAMPFSTPSTNLQLVTCAGDSAMYAGTSIPAGASQLFTLNSFQGCDSLVTVSVAELPNSFSSLILSACPGDSALYAGTPVPAGSSQFFVLNNWQGCDSTITVTVAELPTGTGSASFSACPGTSIDYHGVMVMAGTTQVVPLTNWLGCDSLVTVTVTALPAPISSESLLVCSGGFASFNGQMLAAGSVTPFLFPTSQGCDSVVMVTVVELPTSADTVQLSACSGSAALYAGTPVPAGSSQEFTLTNWQNCDSVVTVTVTALPVNLHVLDTAVCANDFFNFNGQMVPPGTQALFPVLNQWGCMDTFYVNVEALPTATGQETLVACPGSFVAYAGELLSPGQVRDFPFTTANGCDSVVTVTVLALPSDTVFKEVSICHDETFEFHGQMLGAGEQSWWVGTNQYNCDSVVVVIVGAYPSVDFELVAERICWDGTNGEIAIEQIQGNSAPYSFSLDGGLFQSEPIFTQLSAGEYQVSLMDVNGCVFSKNLSLPTYPPLQVAMEDKTLPCEGDVLLQPEVLSDLPVTWLWSDSLGSISTDQALLVNSPGIYGFTVSNDCDTLTRQVNVSYGHAKSESPFYLPTAFSPDGDGINDCFTAYCAPDVDLVAYQLLIFDRWGELIFNGDEMDDCWDGNFKGKPLDSMVFVYWLNLTARNCEGVDEAVFLKGEVLLVR
jgi:gliding motility-associated-like protein